MSDDEVTRIIPRRRDEPEPEMPALELRTAPAAMWVYALWRPLHLLLGLLSVMLVAASASWFGAWWALAVALAGPVVAFVLAGWPRGGDD